MCKVVAWDTETCLIRPGKHAPELVCMTWQFAGYAYRGPSIVHGRMARSIFESFLDDDVLMVGHNVAYDMGVMGAAFPDLVPAIFAKYDADLVTDTMIRQKLLDIAAGEYRGKIGTDNEWVKVSYHLSDIVKRHTGRYMLKDGWRLYYGEFIDVPISEWPAHSRKVQDKFRPDYERLRDEQLANPKGFTKKQLLADLREMMHSPPDGVVQYPLDDATGTLDGFLGQERHAEPYLRDQFRAARKDFWLHLMSAWGLRTTPEGVARLQKEAEELYEEIKVRLVKAGLVRPNGTRDTKAAKALMESVCLGQGIRIRLTKGTETNPDGGIALDEDACKATEHPVLEDYAAFAKVSKVLSNDTVALSQGIAFPIHTHFGMAETGRTTSSNPNVQNFGKEGGARECFAPRRGFVYAIGDVDQLELRTLAQVCLVKLGASRLAEVLNGGLDPHTSFACNLLGIPYEKGLALKDAADTDFYRVRQGCKFTNFALPGGVGAAKMVIIAQRAGIDLGDGQGEEAALEKAKQLKASWFEMWPEMRGYFDYINSLKNPCTGLFDLVQLYTERRRGGAKYTAACNSWFQGLGADGAGEAGWRLAKACYVDRASPLFGSRPVNHSHDDFVVEVPDNAQAHDAAQELARHMVEGFGKYTPDVPIRVKPYLTRLWTKKAGPVMVDGRLIPWDGEYTQAAISKVKQAAIVEEKLTIADCEWQYAGSQSKRKGCTHTAMFHRDDLGVNVDHPWWEGSSKALIVDVGPPIEGCRFANNTTPPCTGAKLPAGTYMLRRSRVPKRNWIRPDDNGTQVCYVPAFMWERVSWA